MTVGSAPDRLAGPVICAVDGSDAGRSAAAVAAALAGRLGVALELVHVAGSADDAEARRLLEDTAAAVGATEASVRVEQGSPAARLLELAGESAASLLVAGTRGRGAVKAALLGSVSSELVASASHPVVVVRAGVGAELDEPLTIVCGLDAGECAREALALADALAERLGARLVLAHAAPDPHVPGASASQPAAAQLRHEEVEDGRRLLERLVEEVGPASPHETRVVLGPADRVLTGVAADESAALLVLGSRGRGARTAAVLGSVSAGVVRSAPCPVVVAPRAAAVDEA